MKALVLNSGGCDSTTCVAIAVDKYGKDNVITASLYYGQKHDKELQCAKKIAEYYGVKHIEEDISNVMKYASNVCTLVKGGDNIEHASYAEQIAKHGEGRVATYVPFRNGLLLSIATAYADSLFPGEEVEVFYGAHADDAAGEAYADCSPEFADAMDKAINIGTYGKIHICRPLINLNKAGVVKKGLELGVPYELTWSCISVEDRVFALSGYKNVNELKVGDYVWGYTDKWQPAKVEKIMFNGVKPLYRVILQDQIGRLTSFKCTDDHRLMMRDGSYKMLCECKVGDKVMPAYPRLTNNYYSVKPHNNWKEKDEYMHRIVAEFFGFINEVVHHKDKNTFNNEPSNLEGLLWGEHSELAEHIYDEEKNKQRAEAVRTWWANMSKEEYDIQCQLIRDGLPQNHTIKSIEYYGEGETFDLQTSTSNFALEAQLFVHNCYEGGEKACGTCGTCIDRINAFKLNGVEDPIEYINNDVKRLNKEDK